MSDAIAIDIGGTFIDAIALDRETGTLTREKVATDPTRLREGVVSAIDRLSIDLESVSTFVHGTTLGVNAVVERQGSTVGLLTNAGFEDVLEIGRETVPDEHRYEMAYRRPAPLVPRRRRIGVPGRIDPEGEVTEPLDELAVRDATDALVAEHDVEAVAVCFLHSYLNPDHERRARALVNDVAPGVSVSISSDITREYREFERTSTAAIEAYIKPLVESYVDDLLADLRSSGFDGNAFITRSGGGALSARKATAAPVHTLFSGPAGALIGCISLAEAHDIQSYVALDIGGTTTDACVAQDGRPALQYRSSIDDRPVMIPRFDIRSIGAGGGSVAAEDKGLLQVGPRSAGAYPGPACYGRGGARPTVTDAAAVVGYLDPQSYLGGELALDVRRAREAIRDGVADPLGLSVGQAASGILRVAVTNITNAVTELTVEKGLDPRGFTAIAYGGAGPLLVPTVARELGVERVLVPRFPAVFSSWGMLRTDVVYDASRTHVAFVEDADGEVIASRLSELEAELAEELASEGFAASDRRFDHAVELRYRGQEHTVDVPVETDRPLAGLIERFESAYLSRYNHTQEGPIELVTLRCRGVGRTPVVGEDVAPDTAEGAAPASSREAYCVARGGTIEFDVYDRNGLTTGDRISGPAIVQEPTATTVLHSDQVAESLRGGHLSVRTGA